jgi:hypothetical protein
MHVQKDISKNYIKKFTSFYNDEVISKENEKEERNDDKLGMMTIDYE